MSGAKKLPGPCFPSGLPNLSAREATRFQGLIDAARAELASVASPLQEAGILAYVEGWLEGSKRRRVRS